MKSFPRWARVVAGLTAVAVLAVVAILFLPPPAFVLRPMVRWAMPLLLSDTASAESRPAALAKKGVRTYLNVALATHLSRRAMAGGGSDEEVLARMMEQARDLVLAPRAEEDVRHPTAFWPSLFSGVGFCDQINGVIGRMASHRFPEAQLVALYGPDDAYSIHTIGRVWSPQRNRWLYYDAFYATPVLFTRDDTGRIEMLTIPARPLESRPPAPAGIYASDAIPAATFESSFGAYVWTRLTQRWWPQPPPQPLPSLLPQSTPTAPEILAETDVAPAVKARGPSAASTGAPPARVLPAPAFDETSQSRGILANMSLSTHRDERVYASVLDRYADARVRHIFDGRPATTAYRAVANYKREADRDDRAAEIVSVASRFAQQRKPVPSP